MPFDFDPAVIETVYSELETLTIDLDDDPLAYGPKRLNAKTAAARRALTRCENSFLQMSRTLQQARRARLKAEAELQLKMDELFAHDPETRSGRNVSDRESIARLKLKAEVSELARLAEIVLDIEGVLVVVRAKRSDLRDAMGRLRDQVRLCTEEIGLGGRWGSQKPGAAPAMAGRQVATAADVSKVDDLIGDMEGEIHVAQAAGTWVAPDGEEPDLDAVATPKPDLQAVVDAAVAIDLQTLEAVAAVGAIFDPKVPTIVGQTTLIDTATQEDVDSFMATGPTMPAPPPSMSDADLDAFLEGL